MLMERYLDVNTMRQTIVSTNAANIDTPGYHARDVDFRGELARAMNGEDTSMKNLLLATVSDVVCRPRDKNRVDREAMLLAEVQLQYKAAIAILRAQFAQITTAIREGQ
jgi:flagellar basal-body rod protein FlgB